MTSHAQTFHDLHRGPGLLRLANAWDPGSARLIESLGAPAIATTSAAVAWAHGYPDGDALPPALVASTAQAIVRAVRIPVSVDFEGGFSSDPAEVAALAARLVDAGVVGINLEDGDGAPDLLCRKIEAIRARADALFINARTDVYLRGLGAESGRLDESIARAARYRDAGASGIFVPGVSDPDAIGALVRGIALPLNVLARVGLPSVAELTRLGVRRLSAGSAIAQTVWGRTAALATAFLTGDSGVVDPEGAMTYGAINALVTR